MELGPRTRPLRQLVRVCLLPRVPWIRRSLATGQGLLFCSGSSQTIPDHQGPDSFPRAAGQITADPAEFQRPEIQNFCRWAEVMVSQGWAPTRGFRREPLPVSGSCLRCLPCVCITPVCKVSLLNSLSTHPLLLCVAGMFVNLSMLKKMLLKIYVRNSKSLFRSLFE